MPEFQPIGYCHCLSRYPYDVPRQGILAGDNLATVRLLPEYAPGLRELEGFSHIWILFWFHHNETWHPFIQPPRHLARKVGVFASRSPYRPNPIGLSCVRLLAVRQNEIDIAGHDLLDGTPVLDLKPYLAYADSFPEATPGWTAEDEKQAVSYELQFDAQAENDLNWLEENGAGQLRSFARDRLTCEPLNRKRNRLLDLREDGAVLAYRTWRLAFDVKDNTVTVTSVFSGYSENDLQNPEDKYGDKELHRRFRNRQSR